MFFIVTIVVMFDVFHQGIIYGFASPHSQIIVTSSACIYIFKFKIIDQTCNKVNDAISRVMVSRVRV